MQIPSQKLLKTLEHFVLVKKVEICIIKDLVSTELFQNLCYKEVISQIIMVQEEFQFMEINLMMKILNINIQKLVFYQWPMQEEILMGLNFLLLQ